MPTVNFSVSKDTKSAFNVTVEGQNKGVVISGMSQAIENVKAKRHSQTAFLRILKRRQNASVVTQEEFYSAREAGCP